MGLTNEAKILQAIGLVASAHQVVYGQRLLEMMSQQKIFLVILTFEVGPSQKKKVVNKANYYKIEVLGELVKKEDLKKIFNRGGAVAAVGISDVNLANLIKSYQT